MTFLAAFGSEEICAIIKAMPSLSTPGARLEYLRTGNGPAVLLVQGVGVVGEGWRPQVDGLAAGFDLVSFDNRGIGASTIEDGRLTIEAMADDALAIMDAERLDRFHLVGHSMGGLIAQEIALRVPQRVISLALLCTFADGRDGARLTPAMLARAVAMRIGTRRMRREAFMKLVMPASYLEQVDRAELARQLQPLFGRDLAQQPPIIMKQVRAMSRYVATAPLSRLASIRTLVVSAVHDMVAPPAYGRDLAERVPGARYVEIPAAGHGVTIQKAREVNDLLREHFIRRRGQMASGSAQS